MAKYIALIDISDYKKGQEVPEEKALIWNKMYANPVCEIVKEPVAVAPVKKLTKAEQSVIDIVEDLKDDGIRNNSTKKRK